MMAKLCKCDRCGTVVEFRPGNGENADTWWSLHLHAQGIGGEVPVGGIQGDLCLACYTRLPEFWKTFLKSERADRAYREDPAREQDFRDKMEEEVQERIDEAVHDQSEMLNSAHAKAMADLRVDLQSQQSGRIAQAIKEHEVKIAIQLAKAEEEGRLTRARNKRSRTAKKAKPAKGKTRRTKS